MTDILRSKWKFFNTSILMHREKQSSSSDSSQDCSSCSNQQAKKSYSHSYCKCIRLGFWLAYLHSVPHLALELLLNGRRLPSWSDPPLFSFRGMTWGVLEEELVPIPDERWRGRPGRTKRVEDAGQEHDPSQPSAVGQVVPSKISSLSLGWGDYIKVWFRYSYNF